jgi:hypothetical protein
MAGGFLRPGRHLPLRGSVPGPAGGSPGPGRCDTDPVLTGTMWHCPGSGAVADAASSRGGVAGGTAGTGARRAGCARDRRKRTVMLMVPTWPESGFLGMRPAAGQ